MKWAVLVLQVSILFSYLQGEARVYVIGDAFPPQEYEIAFL